ncbi:MAG: phospholipid/cholesterol/gamma-HCH transport system substrate-binding protein [Actinomycetota bacterium]|jgi:phospholipid/cholesterol/gamma-HCH transport system substrate-binding protein|nr:phospholipid/cholesterol/gamma-HCH transport system substrate-binding protein [Actinomycetota bacterium]
MTPFRERNPVMVGAVGLGIIVALLLFAFNIDRIPFINGTQYSAAITEAGGLKPNDEVRIAGVKVGKVTDVTLEGDHVKVTFRVSRGTKFGKETGASVRIKTLLGQKFLMLEPRGPGQLAKGAEIPVTRTIAAYDVVEAFSGLATTTDAIDTKQLADSLDTIATTFKDSPADVRAAVQGLGRLSRTIASRDTQLRELLSHTNGVSKVLADRNVEFTKLIADGDLLLKELDRRRADIHVLLVNTSKLSVQLTALVRENRQEMGPALLHLRNVVAVLQRNQDNLDRSIAMLGPFVRVFANTLGNGRWFDTYVENLIPVEAVPAPPGGTP